MTEESKRTLGWVMGLIALLIVACSTQWLTWVYGNIHDIHATVDVDSQRISKLEEASFYTKDRIGEISRDVKTLLEMHMVKDGERNRV